MCTQSGGRRLNGPRTQFPSSTCHPHTHKVKILLFHEADCVQETHLPGSFLIFSLRTPADVYKGGPGFAQGYLRIQSLDPREGATGTLTKQRRLVCQVVSSQPEAGHRVLEPLMVTHVCIQNRDFLYCSHEEFKLLYK